MMRAYFVFLLAALQVGCAICDKPMPNSRLRVHNLAPEFLVFWDSVKEQSADEQLAAVKKDFFPKFSEFYKYKVDSWKRRGKNPDDEIKRELAAFKKIEDGFREKTEQITRDLDASVRSFQQAVSQADLFVAIGTS